MISRSRRLGWRSAAARRSAGATAVDATATPVIFPSGAAPLEEPLAPVHLPTPGEDEGVAA
jgi:hypothetical protein